jgi:hypothetical protein
MGNLLRCCFKTSELKEPILNIVGVYDENYKLVKISDIIESKTVNWNHDRFSEMRYNDMLNEALVLRKKMKSR